MVENFDFKKSFTGQFSQTLEEPEVVRMKVNQTYEMIRADEKKKKAGAGKYRRRLAAAVAAAAAVAVVAGTPVMAKGIGKAWNAVVAAMFGADERTQEIYGETGLSQTFDEEAQKVVQGEVQKDAQEDVQQGNDRAGTLPKMEAGGMTVSLQQVLTDGYLLYLYVDVEAPEGIALDGTCVFDRMELLADGRRYEGTEGSMGLSAGFVEDAYAISKNHRGYEVTCFASRGFDLDGRHLALRLQDFLVDRGKQDMETAVEGVWTLEWDMNASYHGKTVSIDLAGGKAGEHAALKSIDITPLSYALYYEYDGSDMQLFDDTLWVEFVMKDGTVVNERKNVDSIIIGNGGSRGPDCDREGFVKILDIDNVAGVRIDGVTYPVAE